MTWNGELNSHKAGVIRDIPDDGPPGPNLPELSSHEAQNQAAWDAESDAYQARHGDQLAESTGLAWGVTQIPEAELRILGDVAGKDILEFGCGAAQWSIALAKLGARPVGIDLSERQLAHARRLMAEAGVEFPLLHASAEAVPLPDASFDIVFCDHGAMTSRIRTGRCPRPPACSGREDCSRSATTRRSRPSPGRSTPIAPVTGS